MSYTYSSNKTKDHDQPQNVCNEIVKCTRIQNKIKIKRNLILKMIAFLHLLQKY